MWPDYASGLANIPSHAFGVAGAVCSTALTPLDTLPVVEHQLPAFADRVNDLNLDMKSTVFVLWIGTNDAVSSYLENWVSRAQCLLLQGHGRLLDSGQAEGVTMVDVARCGADWVQSLYSLGARNFISMNVRRG